MQIFQIEKQLKDTVSPLINLDVVEIDSMTTLIEVDYKGECLHSDGLANMMANPSSTIAAVVNRFNKLQ